MRHQLVVTGQFSEFRYVGYQLPTGAWQFCEWYRPLSRAGEVWSWEYCGRFVASGSSFEAAVHRHAGMPSEEELVGVRAAEVGYAF